MRLPLLMSGDCATLSCSMCPTLPLPSPLHRSCRPPLLSRSPFNPRFGSGTALVSNQHGTELPEFKTGGVDDCRPLLGSRGGRYMHARGTGGRQWGGSRKIYVKQQQEQEQGQ